MHRNHVLKGTFVHVYLLPGEQKLRKYYQSCVQQTANWYELQAFLFLHYTHIPKKADTNFQVCGVQDAKTRLIPEAPQDPSNKVGP